jgi:putative membrane protein (TIGR04086 family)
MAVAEEEQGPGHGGEAGHGGGPGGLDWRAAGEGALWTIVVALPPVWLVLLLKSDDLPGEESNLWLLTPVALLLGFAVGGFVAARRRPRTPFVHAAAAGALAFAVVTVVSIVRRLLNDGDQLTVSYLARLLLLAQICVSSAVLGGYVGMRRSTRA